MKGGMILSPDEGTKVIDRSRFEQAARERWPEGELVEVRDPQRPADLVMQIPRQGGPLFQVYHSRDNDSVWTDNDPELAAEVALWVASLLPEKPGGRIWFCDEGFTGHVELRRGITLEELREGWVDHEDEPPEFREAAGSGP